MKGLGGFLDNVLGKDAREQIEAHGLDLNGPPLNGKPVAVNTDGSPDYNLAAETLNATTREIRQKLNGRTPRGPNAAAGLEAPPEVVEENKRKEDLGEGAAGPDQGESVRKFTAKNTVELPVIKASPELMRLLEDGKIEEFNKARPAGRLDLSGSRLARRNLAGADLRYCELARADLSGADLSGAQLQHANLDRAVLDGATLNEVKAFEAVLTHANLRNVKQAIGAQFAGADLTSAELQESNFGGAVFSDAVMLLARLDHASFKGAIMSGAILARTVVNHTSFEGALLDNARFSEARGRDVIFKDAILVGAEALKSQFSSSEQKVDNGTVLKTTFEGAWIERFQHRGAIPELMLAGAKREGVPPPDKLPKIPQIDHGKVLIDGMPGTDKVRYDAAMAELNELIGLKDFKALVPELLSHLKASISREQLGLPAFERKLHYVMVGPPGTGKTTCARILGKLFGSLGLLADGHVIETDKSGFIAGFAGQTLSKTNELIDDSLGGSLIADEIYALTEATNDDYAKDALVVLVKRLWDDRKKFAAFFLGYPKPMKKFIAANVGFDRRMAGIIEFPSYTSGELVDIFKMKMNKLVLSYPPEMLAQTSVVLAMNKELKGERFGNAGTVENVVEDLSKRMSARLDREKRLADKHALTHAVAEDLPSEKFCKLPLSELPPLQRLTWIGTDGKAVGYDKLSTKGEFPSLSPESVDVLRKIIAARQLVDIEEE